MRHAGEKTIIMENIVKRVKRILLVSSFAIACTMLAGCLVVGRAESKRGATAELSKLFGYEPVMLDEHIEKSQYKRFYKDYYYEYKDNNGMLYTYSSVLKPQGLDGATFYYSYHNSINYNRRIIPFYSDTMQKLCDEYGFEYQKQYAYDAQAEAERDVFGNEVQFMGAIFYIDGYEDLKKAAELVGAILDSCRLEVAEEGIIDRSYANTEISVYRRTAKNGCRVGTFKLLGMDSEYSSDDIYTKIKQNYIEAVKRNDIEDDLPEGLIESYAPGVLHGKYNGRVYDLWTIELTEDSTEDNPNYDFELLYKEPKYREDYKYYEGYYSTDMQIQNIIAQLGGECCFSEKEENISGPGYTGTLGDNHYSFGMIDKNHILIKKNDEQYIFSGYIVNPVGKQYAFKVSKEEFEKIFGLYVDYNYSESVFEVKKK